MVPVVAGSNPVGHPNKIFRMNSVKSERINDPLGFLLLAPLAQLVEHRTLNPQVPGSSPGGRTILPWS